MKKALLSIIILLIVPVITLLVIESIIEYKFNAQLREGFIKQSEQQLTKEQLNKINIVSLCSNPEIAQQLGTQITNTVENLLIMKKTAVILIIASFLLIIGIVSAGYISKLNRVILLLIFTPGLYFTMFCVIIFTISNAALLMFAIYYGESIWTGRLHTGIILLLGIGAAIGILNIIKSVFMMAKKARTFAIGKAFAKNEQPQLWQFVNDISTKLGTLPPKNLVLGLDPNFYVTQADVVCLNNKLSGITVYLSLPLCRILSKNELGSILGHELGHFRGNDTKYSLKFYPIYRGLSDSLLNIGNDSQKEGAFAIAMLPAMILLGLFLDAFSTAESKISRERELIADKCGEEAFDKKTMATALIKVHAFSSYWDSIIAHSRELIANENKILKNMSNIFSTFINENKSEKDLTELDKFNWTHPTDSHPSLQSRLEGLDIKTADVIDTALDTVSDPAIELISDYENVEEELSEAQQAIIAKQSK